jgi:hypothetical protein
MGMYGGLSHRPARHKIPRPVACPRCILRVEDPMEKRFSTTAIP